MRCNKVAEQAEGRAVTGINQSCRLRRHITEDAGVFDQRRKCRPGVVEQHDDQTNEHCDAGSGEVVGDGNAA